MTKLEQDLRFAEIRKDLLSIAFGLLSDEGYSKQGAANDISKVVDNVKDFERIINEDAVRDEAVKAGLIKK